MHWRTKRGLGRLIERVGRWLSLPGLLLAWPGMQLCYWGQDIAEDALADKPIKPVLHDPNFVKSTRIE